MGLSVWQILIVVLLLVLLFGRGKISELMGDMAKGIKSFKKGMAEDDDEPKAAADGTDGRQIAADQQRPVNVTRTSTAERAPSAVEDAETLEEPKRDSA